MITDIGEAVTEFWNEPSLAIDLETDGLSPWANRIAVVSLATRDNRVAILHVRGSLPLALVELLSQPRTLIGHNTTGFDAVFLATNGVDVFTPTWYDTLVGESTVLSSGRRDVSRSLRDSLTRRLGAKAQKGMVEDHTSWMNPVLSATQLDYCTRDVIYLHQLMDSQVQKAEETGTVTKALTLEMAIIPAVLRMTINGLPVSEPTLQQHLEWQVEVAGEALWVLEHACGKLNFDSPQQVMRALNLLGAHVTSTAKDVLVDLLDRPGLLGQVATAMVQYRESRQVLKMYSFEWQGQYLVPHSDGVSRCHARFWQVGTETGRFSSSDPNLQQVPRTMRYVFQAPDNHVILSTDYSQIEVRLAAAAANDPALITALGSEDVHMAIASTMFNKPPSEVTKEERRQAKACVFTLLFGGGANTLFEHSKTAGSTISLDQSRDLVRTFFSTYRGISLMRDQAMARARSGRPVIIEMPHGLRRVLVGNDLTGTRILNTTIQGAAASGLKYGLKYALERGIGKYLCATVHDEVVAVVPDGPEGLEVKATLEECMIDGMKTFTAVPVQVSSRYSRTWGEQPIREEVSGTIS